MKKKLQLIIVSLLLVTFVYAGDVAEYVDLGFSSDGKSYTFGQYGVTDKDFYAYAEIYCVDIASNTFISDGVFKTQPSKQTAGKNGKTVFYELLEKNKNYIQKYSGTKINPDMILYLPGSEKKSSSEQVRFQDFEHGTTENAIFYLMDIIMHVEGKDEKAKSSFFINVTKQDAANNVLSKQVVGTPSVKRAGVIDYTINRVFTNKEGTQLIIVMDKKVVDSKGISFRYMIETASTKN